MINAVGGGVMHVIDDKSGLVDVWDGEFECTNVGADAGAGLIGIDQIAQSVIHDGMLTRSLFYTSLLKLEKKPVDDPGGMVRSQVIAPPPISGRLRL